MEKIILGSYTKKTSQGIYQIELDTKVKRLTTAELLIKEDNPTYLGVTNHDILLSVAKRGDEGGIASYNNQQTNVSTITLPGAPLCYIGVDNQRQLAFGANYHQGIVTSYRVNSDGALELVSKIQHHGSGPHANQSSPHVHYTDLTPDNRLVVCDLGNDTVYTYDVDNEGKLSEVAKFKANPGSGPRHVVFHPNGKICYLFGELDSTLTILNYEAETGIFTAIATYSTLPEDYNDFNGGAAIRISQDGKFLYLSNRGHNSIAVFNLNESGNTAKLIQHISTEGDFPRDFDLNSNDQFLVVANQNTDNLSLFERNPETGLLTLIQKDVPAPECVCVYFKNN